MITIQSIRVRNFRSIREATFKPLEEGITGIFGANGAGKTTFLSATMWALFGVRPPEGSVASLRRENSNPATDECSVSVLFKHMNQQVEVIRELKGKANSAVVTIYLDGRKQTVASVTAADTWVMSRLGLDAAGFETAFVIKQKELDKLITSQPRERKQIIERLAGVETINIALKAAREAENASKKSLANFPGSERAVQESETHVSLLQDKLEQMSVDRDGLQAAQQRLIQRSRAVQSTLDQNREAEIALNRDEAQLAAYQSELETQQERQQSLAYLEEIPESGDSVDALRQQHQNLTIQINELNEQLAEVNGQRQSRTSDLGRVEKREAELLTLLQELPEKNESEQQLLERFMQAEQTLLDLQNAIAVGSGHIADLRSSIELLGHSDECPTCHTTLSDAHALVAQFQATIVQRQLDVEEAAHRVVEVQGLIIETKNAIQDRQRREQASVEFERVRQNVKDLRQQIEALKPRWSDAQAQLSEFQKQRERITELGLKARHMADDRATAQKVMQRISELSQEIAGAKSRISASRKAMGKVEIQKLRTEIAQLQRQIDSNAPALEQASGERSQIEARLAVARNNHAAASDQWRRRQEMMRNQEARAVVTTKLDKFRTDTISVLAPELSEHASNLIGEMTNGEFTEVRLDDDFNPSVVTSDNVIRPVGWLSGGELSAVALALRIAIGELITGGNPTLLWADEILTAQDADRRGAMLSLIRQLPIDQIVLVNHTSDAADIVDKTVTLRIDRKNGSYVADAE